MSDGPNDKQASKQRVATTDDWGQQQHHGKLSWVDDREATPQSSQSHHIAFGDTKTMHGRR